MQPATGEEYGFLVLADLDDIPVSRYLSQFLIAFKKQCSDYKVTVKQPPPDVIGIFQVSHRGQVVYKHHEDKDESFMTVADLCF